MDNCECAARVRRDVPTFNCPVALIEENPEDAFFIRRHLFKEAAAETVIFRSGASFLQSIAERGCPFRFVMVSVSMKLDSGLQLIRQLRGMPELRRAVILALGNSQRSQDIQEALNSGANGYYVKGLDFENLGGMVRELEFVQ